MPLHVWTSARLFDGNQNVDPDIVIRQVWVHGDYMGALKRNVLVEALDVQSILTGRAEQDEGLAEQKHASEAEGNGKDLDLCSHTIPQDQAAGFHSPLMF